MKTAVKCLTMMCAAVGLFMSVTTANAFSVVDLTVKDSSGSIGSALFTTNNQNPTGTGFINPFLRIQATNGEEGYNTDAAKPPFDDKAGIWTHSLQLQNLVSDGGSRIVAMSFCEPRS